jgi:SAM-dependent methyltransferase
MVASTLDLSGCCAITYGHPLARFLLGDSLHPGGLSLTTRLSDLMGIDSTSRVLDVGAGLGATSVHLARSVGCHVTGVTLEEDGIVAGNELAAENGVEDLVNLMHGDVMQVDLAGERFDFIVMECVLSILDDKSAALRRLCGLLRPGGRIGLTDVTVSAPLPQDLQGLLATVGCVGGALSLWEYGDLMTGEGLMLEHRRDCRDIASAFMADVQSKVLMVEIASKLGNFPIGDRVIAEAQRLFALARDLVAQQVLGYGLLVARKPD